MPNLRKMKQTQIDNKRKLLERLKREAEGIQQAVKTLEGAAEAAKKECEKASRKTKVIEQKVYQMEEKILEDIDDRDRDGRDYEMRKERETLVRSATEKMKEISRLMEVKKAAEKRKTDLWREVNEHRRLMAQKWEAMGKTNEDIGRLWTEMESI